jgi:hypothetical protein
MSISAEAPVAGSAPQPDKDDEVFLRRFETALVPREEWHHREHIKVAYLYLLRYSFEEAIGLMRAGIKRLNAAHGTPETPTRGYHETMTQAWLRLVHVTLREHGPGRNATDFYEQHPELTQPKVLRLFYSRELINSPEARAGFVPPDLAEFPVPRPGK